MISFIIGVVLILLCFAVGFLPPVFCWVGMAIVYLGALAVIILTFLLILAHAVKKNLNVIMAVVGVGLSALVLVRGSHWMVYTHNYNETRKGLKKKYEKFEILDIYAKDLRNPDFMNYCEYVFNVQLPDSSNVVFHAGYCEVGSVFAEYDVVDDWPEEYLPYYLDLYNQEHGTNIRFENRTDNMLEYSQDRIYVNPYNAEDVKAFLYDYRKKCNRTNNRFSVYLVREEDNKEELYTSWGGHSFPFY